MYALLLFFLHCLTYSAKELIFFLLEPIVLQQLKKQKMNHKTSNHHRLAVCKVCGDQASGFNYSAPLPTCRSCKVFYHRTSKSFQKLKCRHNGSCPITLITRMCCSACRFTKCQAIGMTRKAVDTTLDSTATAETSESTVLNTFLTFQIEQHLNQFGDNYPEEKTNTMAMSHERKKRFATDLTAYELEKIDEVRIARNVFGNEYSVPIIRPTSTVVDIFKIPEIYFRWTIKFCKQFEAFNSLSNDDQFTILKPFVWDATAIHFAFLYKPESNGYPMFEDNQADHAVFVIYDISNGKNNADLSAINIKIWTSLCVEMERDETIRDLLTAQLLFATHKDTACPTFIKYNYCFYSRLLMRHLEAKYKSIADARQKYTRLMRVLNDLQLVKENERNLFSDFELGHINQLVLEMYDCPVN